MKQLSVFILLFCTLNLFADTPGKKEMHDSKVSFQNVGNRTHYTLYWQMGEYGKAEIFNSDTSFYMSASRGAPVQYFLWAVNKIVNPSMSTDTISFHNYYSPDYVIIINEIKGNSILYKQVELSNKNKIVSEGNTDEITDKTLIAEAKKAKRNHYINIGFFIVLGLVLLNVVVWLFRRKKNQQVS
jgi:hypothetical protein